MGTNYHVPTAQEVSQKESGNLYQMMMNRTFSA